MRWFVEIAVGSKRERTAERWTVEGGNWPEALTAVRSLRGEQGGIQEFAVEISVLGLRVLDPRTRARYFLRAAPADAPLTTSRPGRISSMPPSGRRSSDPGMTVPKEPTTQQRIARLLDLPVGGTMRPAAASPSAPAHGAVRLSHREEEPTPETPLTYREVAWMAPPNTSTEAATGLLLALFEDVRRSIERAPPGRLVQMAIFQHAPETAPLQAPLATLTWKDWKSDRPEVRVLGAPTVSDSASSPSPVWQDSPRTPAPELARAPEPAGAPELTSEPAVRPEPRAEPIAPPFLSDPFPSASIRPPPRASSAAPLPETAAPLPEAPAQATATEPKQGDDRGTESEPPRPSLRLRGDDLLGELFETMHELAFVSDSLDAARFVLHVALAQLPSEVGMVHLFDLASREFVLVRAGGALVEPMVGSRTSDRDPLLLEAHRTRRPILLAGGVADERLQGERWAAVRDRRSLLCAPVGLKGRILGAVELANPTDSEVFGGDDANALAYICDRFAEYLAEHGVALEPDGERRRSAG